jgi:hypothetical protein
MSEQAIERRGRFFDLRASLPLAIGAGIYFLLLLLGDRLLSDPDSYSHLALGRWIIEHGAVPTGDPFSHTMAGVHWVAFEWASQVAYATAHAFGGWWGVVVLAAAAIAAAFALLARFLLRQWPALPTLTVVLAAFVLASPHILARPHALALLPMVIWVGALVRAVDEGRGPSWLLLPLMTLWANLHGSFTLGLAILGPIAFEAVWQAPQAERRATLLRWLRFAALAVVAACATPYGPEMVLVTYRTIALGEMLSIIKEWQPQDFSHPGPFEMILFGAMGYALYLGVKLPPLRIVMLFGLLHLGLSQSRHADVFGLLAPLFLAAPLARHFDPQVSKLAAPPARDESWLAAMVFGLLLITGAWVGRRDLAPPANITPAAALASIDVAQAGPILNDYNFGGYLDFVGVPPFIDGRMELYGAAFTLRYHRAVTLEDLPDFLRLLDEYRIGTTLLAPTTLAVALLDRLPDWQRVYADDVAVVHTRRKDTTGRLPLTTAPGAPDHD